MPPLSPLLAQLDDQHPHSHQGQASSILSCHFPSILGNPCGSFLGPWLGWLRLSAQTHAAIHMPSTSLSSTPAAQKPQFEPTTGQDQCWGAGESYTGERWWAPRPATWRDYCALLFGVTGERETEDIIEKKHALPVTPWIWLGISGPQSISGIVSEKKDSRLWWG